MTELFHDKDRGLMVYKTDPIRLHQIAHAIPETRLINGSLACVPHTLQNVQTLRFYNFPVVPVITDENYDWPIKPGWKPLAHQKVTANFMVAHPRSFNLSDMGTMKTLSTLWAADFLMKQHEPGTFRALIMSPLSTLERVWANAIFSNFLQRRTFKILHGEADRRSRLLAEPADFYILNHDGIKVGAKKRKRIEIDGFAGELADRHDIKLLIIDEASAFKDHTTTRHRVTRMVVGEKPYMWLLTGTPTPQAPTDAFGLAYLVNRAFGKSFRSFQLETMSQVAPFKWVPHKDGYDKARRILTPSIRYDLHDIWDGPGETSQQRSVQLTDEQTKLLHRLRNDLTIALKGAQITAVNEAALRIKLLQIALGAVYDSDHKAHGVDANPRLRELIQLVTEAPGKCLIFAPFRSIVTMLHRGLSKFWPTEMVHGDVSPKERSKIFEAFQQEGGPRLLVADPGTMQHGLDLWMARTTIWYGCSDKAETYAQANRRAYRPGQKYPVTVVQLVATKTEQEIYKRLENNMSLQGALLDVIRKGEF